MKSSLIHVVLIVVLVVMAILLPLRALGQPAAAGPPDLTIDAATKAQIINNLIKELNDGYVFPDVAKKMEADVRARQKNKEYESVTSSAAFAKKLTEDLQSVSKDKHLRVRFNFNATPERKDRREPSEAERAEFGRFMKRINYGFNKVERMDGNIGVIELSGFADEVGGAETVAAAMTFLANTDAIIFDLRRNGGGNPEMIALISSYLFGDKPVHLNDLYWREDNRTEEFWTKPEKAARKFPDKDLYVLTSDYTFSGAEEFSNNLKVLKRATIVGETTGGGANPGGVVRLNEHFSAFVPVGRAVNPVTKTNWEGTGVEPDVKVPKELALKTAYLMALTKSVEKQTNGDIKAAMQDMIGKVQKEIDEMKKK